MGDLSVKVRVKGFVVGDVEGVASEEDEAVAVGLGEEEAEDDEEVAIRILYVCGTVT